MNQTKKGRLKQSEANQSISMVTGCLRCHSEARGRSLAGPSATLHLEGANQDRERGAKKRGPIRGGGGDSEHTTGELRRGRPGKPGMVTFPKTPLAATDKTRIISLCSM